MNVYPINTIDRTLRFADWASLHYNLLWAYDGPIWPQARIGEYTDWDTSCWLLLKGSVTLTGSGLESVTITPGQWVFLVSPTRHQTFSEDAQILSMHFELTWPGGEQVIDKSQNLIFPANEFPQLEKSARPIVQHIKRYFPNADAFLMEQRCSIEHFLLVQKLFPPWIIAYLKALSHRNIHPRRLNIQDERLMQTLAELDSYPLSEKFAEQRILQKIGMSRTQLDHLFSKAYGVTPRGYFEQRRLNEARRLLKYTDLGIKEISWRLGFRHPSNFSMWFRKMNDVNAIAFRKESGRN